MSLGFLFLVRYLCAAWALQASAHLRVFWALLLSVRFIAGCAYEPHPDWLPLARKGQANSLPFVALYCGDGQGPNGRQPLGFGIFVSGREVLTAAHVLYRVVQVPTSTGRPDFHLDEVCPSGISLEVGYRFHYFEDDNATTPALVSEAFYQGASTPLPSSLVPLVGWDYEVYVHPEWRESFETSRLQVLARQSPEDISGFEFTPNSFSRAHDVARLILDPEVDLRTLKEEPIRPLVLPRETQPLANNEGVYGFARHRALKGEKSVQVLALARFRNEVDPERRERAFNEYDTPKPEQGVAMPTWASDAPFNIFGDPAGGLSGAPMFAANVDCGQVGSSSPRWLPPPTSSLQAQVAWFQGHAPAVRGILTHTPSNFERGQGAFFVRLDTVSEFLRLSEEDLISTLH